MSPRSPESARELPGSRASTAPGIAMGCAILALCGTSGWIAQDCRRCCFCTPWRNSTQVNKRYPHGVGGVRARDKTSGTRVTSFKRSNALYNTAMRNNKGLDRDKNGHRLREAVKLLGV
jgi:hypothetical protein